MNNKDYFVYQWYVNDSEEDTTTLRMYCIDKKNDNVCIHVKDFTPYFYVELPEYIYEYGQNKKISWNQTKIDIVLKDRLNKILKWDKRQINVECRFKKKKKLYYANFCEKTKKRLRFPFCLMIFPSKQELRKCMYILQKTRTLNDHILKKYKFKVHQQDASSILQFSCFRKIPMAGWISLKKSKEVNKSDKITLCDHEYETNYGNIYPSKGDNCMVFPLVLSFDIEVNSSNPSEMPKASNPKDKIFQISCILQRGTQSSMKYLLTLGDPDPIKTGKDTTILRFKNEKKLLVGYAKFIQKYNPNVIIGYNILGFDIPYMIKRATWPCNVMNEFDRQGFNMTKGAEEKTINWSSSAYGNQEFQYLDAEGRLFVDLLPLIKRDYRMSNYKLKTVAQFFLGNTKDDLDASDIFRCYREGMEKNPNTDKYTQKARDAMAICGHYCVQDSVLVMDLFNKTQQWIGLCEMAKTCNVPIMSLYTQGQQIKVFSQIYKYCQHNQIIVEKDGYKGNSNEHYIGATVFPPIPGVYDRVLPFDFKSLYPTIIIAYNIDYSTLVPDNSNIPDSECNIIEWKEHVGCKHDPNVIRKDKLDLLIEEKKEVIKQLRKQRDKTKIKKEKQKYVKEIEILNQKLKPYIEERSNLSKKKYKHILCNDKRKYRFLKKPMGVMPTVLQKLLEARKQTRIQIKKLKQFLKDGKEIDIIKPLLLNGKDKQTIETLITVLDKRQLSYKVSCNSMYGAMGVTRGYLPFMPGAMCTTAMGRKNIGIVADVIQKQFKGKLVYGDSVTGDEPLLLMDNNNKIHIKTIENLSKEWKPYENFKPFDTIQSNRREKEKAFVKYKVWSNGEWNPIKKVIRHKTNKKIFRVNTHCGVVDVTQDHSLLDSEGNKLKPENCKIGTTRLLQSFPKIKHNKTLSLDVFINRLQNNNCKDLYTKYITFLQQIYQKYAKDITFISTSKLDMLRAYYYLHILGFQDKCLVSYSDNVFIITLSEYSIKTKNIIKKIDLLTDNNDDFVYDLETEKGIFNVGIGEIVVKNTDSNYIQFPHLKTPQENWDYAIHVAKKVTEMFPKPIELEFEEEIYWRFFILSKKRYMYKKCKRDGHVSEKIGNKGVLLSRRDNSPLVRKIYKTLMMKIFNKVEMNDILYYLITEVNKLCMGCYNYQDFVITKKVGCHEKKTKIKNKELIVYLECESCKMIIKCNNPDFNNQCKCLRPEKGRMGDYKVPLLAINDRDKMSKQFKLKKCDNEEDYYTRCLPAQVQLAERMRKKRGQRVDQGSRIEYVITLHNDHKGKQYEKIEHIDYFMRHKDVLKIDYLYYLDMIANPIDQMLNVMYQGKKGYQKDFIAEQYKFRWKQRSRIINDISKLSKPLFKIE